MIGSWNPESVAESRRYIEYAYAYLEASTAMCLRMQRSDGKRTWPHACVAMWLAAHSVELFLKGMILTRSPGEQLNHHRIDALYEVYATHFRDPSYEIDIPFRTEYVNINEAVIESLKQGKPSPSIFFRYPTRKPDVEWKGVHAFIPEQFEHILQKLNTDYARIAEIQDIHVEDPGR